MAGVYAMRKLMPGWLVKGKVVCADCVGDAPKGPWQLISKNACANKDKHKKVVIQLRRRKSA